MDASLGGNIVQRLAARTTRIGAAGIVAWASLCLLIVPTAQSRPTMATIALVLGVLGLWTIVLAALIPHCDCGLLPSAATCAE
ncbi:MAG: hypothetical protein JKY37_18070 [Nannocystaceae bacterium]|nr:hypothetical protein [Nannocystaceae bacterium]